MFKSPLIAIDIGSSAIKVVEMSGGGTKKLRCLGLELLPNGAVVDGIIQDGDTVEAALKKIITDLKIPTRGRRAAVTISGPGVIVRRVLVQVSPGLQVSEVVMHEAEQHISSDLSDVYYDYWELPATRLDEKPLLIVGAKREQVETHLSVVRATGLRTAVVDCDVFCLENVIEHSYGVTDVPLAIVSIGASRSTLAIVKAGQHFYMSDISIAGTRYTQAIADKLGITFDNAEALKISASTLSQIAPNDGLIPTPPPEVMQCIAEVNEALVNEISVALQSFFASGMPEFEGQSIAQIVLAGGGSRVNGLDAAIAASIQIPVALADPFRRINISPKKFPTSYVVQNSQIFAVAIGLGLRQLDEKREA